MEVFALFLWSVGLINAASNAPVPPYYAGAAHYGYPIAAPPVLPVYRAEALPVPRGDSAAAKAFGEHWQNFMEPSVCHPAALHELASLTCQPSGGLSKKKHSGRNAEDT